MSALREMCRGRWGSILPALGISETYLKDRHGPCPACGGKDRFRYDDRDQTGNWICNQCGAGDGFSLLMKVNHIDFPSAAALVETVVGTVPVPSRREIDEYALRRSMNRTWLSGQRIIAGDPVAAYLEKRGIVILPLNVRYLNSCRYGTGPGCRMLPAMLARITAPDDHPSNIHRTYLSPELPQKADVDPNRKVMPGRIGKGSAIRLAPFDPWLGVAEGIETSLSAAQLFSVPVWSAVSSGMLMQFEPPPETKELTIFGDYDRNFAGQSAAFALAHRLSHQRPNLKVSVRVPEPITGRDKVDWNDWLMAA